MPRLQARFDGRELQKVCQKHLSLPKGNFPKGFKKLSCVFGRLGGRLTFRRNCR